MGDPNQLLVRQQGDSVCFDVRVSPRASRAAIAGVHAGALKVSLTAAPVDGAANAALIELLAKRLGVPRRALRIARGEHARNKSICVEGSSADTVRAALSPDAGTR